MVVVVVVVVSGFAFGEVQRVDVGPFCMILHNDFAVIACMTQIVAHMCSIHDESIKKLKH